MKKFFLGLLFFSVFQTATEAALTRSLPRLCAAKARLKPYFEVGKAIQSHLAREGMAGQFQHLQVLKPLAESHLDCLHKGQAGFDVTGDIESLTSWLERDFQKAVLDQKLTYEWWIVFNHRLVALATLLQPGKKESGFVRTNLMFNETPKGIHFNEDPFLRYYNAYSAAIKLPSEMVLVPSVLSHDISMINEMYLNGLAPLEMRLVGAPPFEADSIPYDAYGYFLHDLFHAYNYFRLANYAPGIREQQLQTMKGIYENKLKLAQSPVDQKAIEFAFFIAVHERPDLFFGLRDSKVSHSDFFRKIFRYKWVDTGQQKQGVLFNRNRRHFQNALHEIYPYLVVPWKELELLLEDAGTDKERQLFEETTEIKDIAIKVAQALDKIYDHLKPCETLFPAE